MFEKSLYDLIRGLRSHKGKEEEYIKNCIRECRTEIKSQDMDLKATALLKLIYLEMFGHDMTWVSFHVLEVMSSKKYHHKRVGYLGAVQSFHSDTDVLMLATNLLKKDLGTPEVSTMSLPLLTLPHIFTPGLALSLLHDVNTRLTHPNSAVRKKTVVNLYRLSLVFPEAFRISWPNIKERLMDDDEDPSVTAAVINVVCELGWRRPYDFLPLAPRLFDLLINGGNNWMAIKIIKLFATMTPLEPRLVRKLLRPLINLIQTTNAMSLLYECINGIIQGGILEGAEGIKEGAEIANLCVDKLRGMIVLEGDPNLKYVALLAFNRIMVSHPDLVANQQDVIMNCLDNSDLSIRLLALELVSGIIASDILQPVVNHLITQLQTSRSDFAETGEEEAALTQPPVPAKKANEGLVLTDHYRKEVLHRILDMCSRDTYSLIVDFEWYIDTLLQLLKLLLPSTGTGDGSSLSKGKEERFDLAHRIGYELRNVAVRVKGVRLEATRAAEALLLLDNRSTLFPSVGLGALSVLGYASWIVGEYAENLAFPDRTMTSLTHHTNLSLPPSVLAHYIQAIPKVFASIASSYEVWDAENQGEASLMLARMIDFLDNLSLHPRLEVQERAIEFLNLFRLTAEAISLKSEDVMEMEQLPMLLSTVIPGMFKGLDLNPVAPGAQHKIPIPENLDLDQPVNPMLAAVLADAGDAGVDPTEEGEIQKFYFVPEPVAPPVVTKQFTGLQGTFGNMESPSPSSYQNAPEILGESAQARAKKLAERHNRNKDDPFYITQNEDMSGASTPLHQVLRNENGDEFDVDSIPVIDLGLGNLPTTGTSNASATASSASLKPAAATRGRTKPRQPKKVEIMLDETLDFDDSKNQNDHSSTRSSSTNAVQRGSSASRKQQQPKQQQPQKLKKPLLQVDSSGLSHLTLDETNVAMTAEDFVRKEEEEKEMARAMAQIEKFRLQMQRSKERVKIAEDVPPEGVLVQRKKKEKKKKKPAVANGDKDQQAGASGATATPAAKKKKQQKSKKSTENEASGAVGGGENAENEQMENNNYNDNQGREGHAPFGMTEDNELKNAMNLGK